MIPDAVVRGTGVGGGNPGRCKNAQKSVDAKTGTDCASRYPCSSRV